MTNNIKSPVRWVGGKSSLASQIIDKFPKTMNTYIEPFLGGGTIFLDVLQQHRARKYMIADINPHLVTMWTDIRANYPRLISEVIELKTSYDHLPNMESKNRRYHELREELNSGSSRQSAVFLVLNRTAFNALVRYNSRGQFNSAFGKRDTVVLDIDNLQSIHSLMSDADIIISQGDFESVTTRFDCFFYLDPPYHILKDRKIDDTTYNKDGFTSRDEYRLRNFCDRIVAAGGDFVLSNHECLEVLTCFAGFPYKLLKSYKSFTGKASSRKETQEIILGPSIDLISCSETSCRQP